LDVLRGGVLEVWADLVLDTAGAFVVGGGAVVRAEVVAGGFVVGGGFVVFVSVVGGGLVVLTTVVLGAGVVLGDLVCSEARPGTGVRSAAEMTLHAAQTLNLQRSPWQEVQLG
jgi:hypothetical protein